MFVAQENLKNSHFHRKDTHADFNGEPNSTKKIINVGGNVDMEYMMGQDIFVQSPFLGVPKKSPAFGPAPSPNFPKPSPKMEPITTPSNFLKPPPKGFRKSSKIFSNNNIAGLAQSEMPNLIGDQVDQHKMEQFI